MSQCEWCGSRSGLKPMADFYDSGYATGPLLCDLCRGEPMSGEAWHPGMPERRQRRVGGVQAPQRPWMALVSTLVPPVMK